MFLKDKSVYQCDYCHSMELEEDVKGWYLSEPITLIGDSDGKSIFNNGECFCGLGCLIQAIRIGFYPKENAECTNISETNQKLKEKLDKFKK